MTRPDVEEDLAYLEDILLNVYGRTEALDLGAAIENPVKRAAYYLRAVNEARAMAERAEVERHPSVDPATFLDDEYFMGARDTLWPALRREIITACSGAYVEAVFTGSIGTGKTTAALYTQAYFLYRLLNLRDPHREFELDPNSEIAFIMQSITGGTAYTVDYMRFRRMLEGSPWFRENAPHENERKATIQFKHTSVMVQPLPGNATAAIGENVFGGLIDEVNHMKVVRKSSRTADGTTHDQMLENYRAVARRRESRFQRTGRVPGMLCLVGSANFAGQFTDRKRNERDAQLRREGHTSIYIFDKRPWEVQPADRFSPERFRVFLGDGTRKPRVIPDTEHIPAEDEVHVMNVPVDYRNAFESDLPGAVKDIAGIALHGFSGFMSNYNAVHAAFRHGTNIFAPDWCNFDTQPALINPPTTIPNPKAKRYIHVDLALSMDNAAFTMAHCSGFRYVDRGGGMKDLLPIIQIDGMLSIRPSGGSQIPIYKIRKLVFVLKEMGYPIHWVSLDGFQSADFIQEMRRAGFKSGIVSLDKTPAPYLLTRTLIYDECLLAPPSDLATKELSELVWVAQDGKVDHPPDGSKDLSDTIAGCSYGLATKKEVWVAYGMNPAKSSIMLKGAQE